MFEIAVYKNGTDRYTTEIPIMFMGYKSNIIPHIGEEVYFPHIGLYKVIKVVYNISDDNNNEFNNEIMFVDIVVE